MYVNSDEMDKSLEFECILRAAHASSFDDSFNAVRHIFCSAAFTLRSFDDLIVIHVLHGFQKLSDFECV